LEPEDPKYVEMCQRVYKHVAATDNFDHLWSTRHYGGMVFHYVFNRAADPLLHHLTVKHRLTDTYNLLRLYYLINPRKEVSNPVPEPLPTEQSVTKLAQQPIQVSLEQVISLLKVCKRRFSLGFENNLIFCTYQLGL